MANTGGVPRSRPIAGTGPTSKRFFPKIPASGGVAIASTPDINAGFNLKHPADTGHFDRKVRTFRVSPATVEVEEAATEQLTAVGVDEMSVPVTINQAQVGWTSTDTDVATVDTDGVVTGVAEGECSVIATWGKFTASTAVTVTAAA